MLMPCRDVGVSFLTAWWSEQKRFVVHSISHYVSELDAFVGDLLIGSVPAYFLANVAVSKSSASSPPVRLIQI